MRVVFASAEVSPVATVGGLAFAVAGLAAELRRLGVDVEVVMPDYGGIALVDETSSSIAVPGWVGAATLRIGRHPSIGRLHLVSVPGMARAHPYLQPNGHGWPDNHERFFRFAAAVAEYVRADPPDVLHLNDWHTATVLAALDDPPPSVLSIHNLAYQGTTDGTWLARLGPRSSHYEWWGDTNPLSGGIALADRVVAVSPHYAWEITTGEGGFGLDGALRARGDALVGILNGIDTDLWNPATDPLLESNYDVDSIDGRAANRTALLNRLGWPVDDVPLATVVTRLTHQKGIDLITPIVPLLDEIPMRIAVLGSGDVVLADELRYLAGDVSRHVGVRRRLRRSAVAPTLRRRRRVPHAEQVRAVRAHTDAGHAVRGGPGGHGGRGVGRHRARRRSQPTDRASVSWPAGPSRRTCSRRCSAPPGVSAIADVGSVLQKRMMSIDWSWAAPAADYLALYQGLLPTSA